MKAKELEKLRKKLPKRYRMILLERLNKYSLSTINQVLTGWHENTEIIDAAIKLAEEYQGELKERQEKIKSL